MRRLLVAVDPRGPGVRWGDTYLQFRAGQSFNLRGLPNGKYFVAVIANLENRLVEASKDNNVSLRKVFIGGTPGHRTVRVPQVGLVEEEFSFEEQAPPRGSISPCAG